MKRILIVIAFIFVLLISFLGITYSYEYKENESLKFELIGDSTLYVDLNSEYHEYGVKVIYNGVDISSSVKIDNSAVNVYKSGQYKVRYEVYVDDHTEYIYRTVNIVDKIKPEIFLNGDEVVYINLGDSYIEDGYKVIDNDNDLEDKVVITSNLSIMEEGEYTIEYKVVDSSGNEGIAIRKVIVRK